MCGYNLGADSWGRVARAFDVAGISNEMGAPSFAFCAKGGNRKCLRDMLVKPLETKFFPTFI